VYIQNIRFLSRLKGKKPRDWRAARADTRGMSDRFFTLPGVGSARETKRIFFGLLISVLLGFCGFDGENVFRLFVSPSTHRVPGNDIYVIEISFKKHGVRFARSTAFSRRFWLRTGRNRYTITAFVHSRRRENHANGEFVCVLRPAIVGWRRNAEC